MRFTINQPKTGRKGAYLLAVVSIASLIFLLPGGPLFAHGEEVVPEDKTIHPITQIGLPEASMGHDHGAATESVAGHTRAEVAALIRDSQQEENVRSTFRLVLLSLSIIGLAFLFYPRRPKREAMSSASPTQAGNTPEGQLQGGGSAAETITTT